MITWFRVVARTIVFRYPLLLGAFRIISSKAQKFREFKNVKSLLEELHSDTALQLPLLVEQNRKMFRDVESLKLEIERLKQMIEKGKNAQ